MTFETRFVIGAVTELDEAIGWYDDRRAGLGLAFLVAVDRTIKFVSQFPQVSRLVDGVAPDLEVRMAPVDRFPYYVAYLVTNDVIVVVAVAHERRRPHYWSGRTGS